MNNKPVIYILIPAYNEEKHIGDLIGKIREITSNIIVVDDGSVDKTARIVRDNNAICLEHKENKGKGASLSDGYNYLLEKGADYIITMDADGQHSPYDIDKFINLAESNIFDIIIGNRMKDTADMPLLRYLTNKFTSAVVSILSGQKIPDSQCGFRMVSTNVLRKVKIKSMNFDAESEILIKASRNGFKIGSVDIKTIYGDEKSKINPIKDTIRFFKLVFRLLKKDKESK